MTAADTGSVQISVATAADVPAIYRLLTELSKSTGLSNKFVSSEGDLQRYGFGETPLFEALLARIGGATVGLSLFFYTYSSWRGEPGVYVQDLVVSEDAQAQGVGRQLLRATVRHARDRGVTHLRLSVEHDNEQAIGFYKALGFRHCDNEEIFQADGAGFEELARPL